MRGHRMTDKESNLCSIIEEVKAYNDTPPILCELSKENGNFFWFASGEGKSYGQEKQD